MAELDLLRCLAILMVVTLHAAAPLLSDLSLLGTPAWYFCLLLDPFSRTGVPLFYAQRLPAPAGLPHPSGGPPSTAAASPAWWSPLVLWNPDLCPGG